LSLDFFGNLAHA